jgi:hypothetical protein
MPAKAADPVVEIVKRDEEHVGFRSGRGIGGGQRSQWRVQQGGDQCEEVFHVGFK